MDLSICIPVYNQDVSDLVQSLLNQAESRKEQIEILIFDDDSSQEYKTVNSKLDTLNGAAYQEMPKNLGRSAIRNKLGQEAKGSYLLFLDDDSQIIREDFLAQYLKLIGQQSIVCGGRVYQKSKPQQEYVLHWTYGSFQESMDVETRKMANYTHFHSNNFLIVKSLFLEHPFNESLTQYGHEDTLFGYRLHQKGIRVHHIDNPIMHEGLENSSEFLAKTKLALENLSTLYDLNIKGFAQTMKILRVYNVIQKAGLAAAMAKMFRRKQQAWEDKLKGNKPSLRLFSLYKLSCFCAIRRT